MGITIIIVDSITSARRSNYFSTPGWLISTWLRCPIIYLEPIIVGLRKILSTTQPQRQAHDHEQYLLNKALDMLFEQVSCIVSAGPIYSKSYIVLDFPLSSWSQLRKLFEVVEGPGNLIDRVLIVECMARSKFTWRNLFERKWLPVWFDHYVKTSDDAEKAMKQHQLKSCTFNINRSESHDDDVRAAGVGGLLLYNRVSKLEMEFWIDYDPALKKFKARLKHLRTSQEDDGTTLTVHAPLFQALECLLNNNVGPLFFSMREWEDVKQHLNLYPTIGQRGKSALCFRGIVDHDIVLVYRWPSAHDDDCGLCEKPVAINSTPYYYCCAYCPLNLHKDCAELLESDQDTLVDTTIKSHEFQPICRTEGVARKFEYELSDPTHVCKSCKEDGKNFSQKCRACLFDTFLKCRLRPVIIRHPLFQTEKDYFQIQISLPKENIFCEACRGRIKDGISYFHKWSSTPYGFSCVAQMLTPVEKLKWKHFGYEHPLKLTTRPHEELDDCICHVCWKERDSELWYYFCEECEYTAHLRCICTKSGFH